MKEVLAIFLLVFFVVTMTAASVSVAPYDDRIH